MSEKRPIVKYGDQFEELRDGDTLPGETPKAISKTLSKSPEYKFDPSQYSLSLSSGQIVLTPYNQILSGFSKDFDKRYISSDPNSTDGLGTIIKNNCADVTPADPDYVPISSDGKLKRLSLSGLKTFLKTYFDTIYTTTSAVATQITTALSGYATQVWVSAQGYLTSVPDATVSVKGIGKLYTSTGTNTDGSMTQNAIKAGLDSKQDTLVSGSNIKPINGSSLLGSSNLLVGSAICGIVAINQGASSTSYYVMNSLQTGVAAAGRAGRQIPFSAGTFKNFYCRLNVAQPASGSQVISLFVNSAVTSISITIAANSAPGVFSDTTNSVSVSGGDLVCYEVVNNATGTAGTIQTTSINFYA